MSAAAIILAGGRATRLDGIDLAVPKALIPFAGRTLLETAVSKAAVVTRSIVVAAGTQAQTISEGIAHDPCVHVVADGNLGTGSALLGAIGHVTADHVVVCNADTLNQVDLRSVLSAHYRRGHGATIVLTQDPEAQNSGSFAVASGGQVIRSLEDRHPPGRLGPSAVWRGASTGILVLPTRLLKDARIAEALSFEQEIIPHIIDSDGLFAFHNGNQFCLDVGAPQRLRFVRTFEGQIAKKIA